MVKRYAVPGGQRYTLWGTSLTTEAYLPLHEEEIPSPVISAWVGGKRLLCELVFERQPIRCPACSRIQVPPAHGESINCPRCGLRLKVLGNSLIFPVSLPPS